MHTSDDIVVVIILFISILFLAALANLSFNPDVIVTKGNDIIFIGNNACVVSESAGDSTKVVIKEWLCLKPKAVYLGDDIKIKPLED